MRTIPYPRRVTRWSNPATAHNYVCMYIYIYINIYTYIYIYILLLDPFLGRKNLTAQERRSSLRYSSSNNLLAGPGCSHAKQSFLCLKLGTWERGLYNKFFDRTENRGCIVNNGSLKEQGWVESKNPGTRDPLYRNDWPVFGSKPSQAWWFPLLTHIHTQETAGTRETQPRFLHSGDRQATTPMDLSFHPMGGSQSLLNSFEDLGSFTWKWKMGWSENRLPKISPSWFFIQIMAKAWKYLYRTYGRKIPPAGRGSWASCCTPLLVGVFSPFQSDPWSPSSPPIFIPYLCWIVYVFHQKSKSAFMKKTSE